MWLVTSNMCSWKTSLRIIIIINKEIKMRLKNKFLSNINLSLRDKYMSPEYNKNI